MNLQELHDLGFSDSSEDGEGYMRVRCNSCSALVINGTPCHETGCPEQRHECRECMTLIPKTWRLCESCANPEPFDEELEDL